MIIKDNQSNKNMRRKLTKIYENTFGDILNLEEGKEMNRKM